VRAGWRVSAVLAEEDWDEAASIVRWGPFFDMATQTLRYTLTPRAGASGVQKLGRFNWDDSPGTIHLGRFTLTGR